MCRPIRSLTEAKGHALSKHVYDVFATYGPSLLLIASLSLSVLQVLAEVGGQCHRVDLIDCLGIIINSRGTTRNRDCSLAEYRQDPHSPTQLNSLCLRPSTRRSVRRFSFAHTLSSTLWHLTLASPGIPVLTKYKRLLPKYCPLRLYQSLSRDLTNSPQTSKHN